MASAEMHTQDEALLRTILGLEKNDPIPEEVKALYFRVRRCRHRVIAGPLSVDCLLFVALASDTNQVLQQKENDVAPEETKKNPKLLPPGRSLPDEGNVIMVRGREYFVCVDGEWLRTQYVGPHGSSGTGYYRFASNDESKKFHVVHRSNVRLAS